MKNQQQGINIEWRGRERFQSTWERQLELHQLRRKGEINDTLIFVEHEPVITLGKRGDQANLVVTEAELVRRGIDFHRIERGGDITFHGPGQLVCYLVVDLRQRGLKVKGFISLVEQAVVSTLGHYGIEASASPGLTGVWVGEIKLAAVGLAIKGGVSYHGLALNVATDLAYYDAIIPCGIADKQVGSISALLGKTVELTVVRETLELELTRALVGASSSCC